MSKPGAPRALRIALSAPESESWSRPLVIAYMRLLVAHRQNKGVRLTSDEVHALFYGDDAIALAAENLEEELIGEKCDG